VRRSEMRPAHRQVVKFTGGLRELVGVGEGWGREGGVSGDRVGWGSREGMVPGSLEEWRGGWGRL